MHYAVCLVNLMSLQELDPVGALLFPPEILGEPVQPDTRYGTDSIRLTCDQDRAEAIVTLIRMKYTKLQFMMFKSKSGKGGWKRIN